MKLLDPTRPDDPRFDPHGEQARRVFAAARTRPPERRRRPTRRLTAAALVAAVAGLLLALLPGTSAPDARAALAESLRQMRDVDSGIVVMTLAGERNEVRFDGEDMEWTSALGVWQRVGGREYENGKPTGVRLSDDSFPHMLVAQVGRQDIVKLAQRAPDLTTRELPDGFEYRATATAGEVFDAMPTAAGRAEGGAWTERVPLTVTVEGGYVRRVRAGEDVTEYLSLGAPQSIERPVT